jgi:hypothetical protein
MDEVSNEPMDEVTKTAVEALERDGFCILKNVLTPEETAKVREGIAALHRPLGRNKFEGLKVG